MFSSRSSKGAIIIAERILFREDSEGKSLFYFLGWCMRLFQVSFVSDFRFKTDQPGNRLLNRWAAPARIITFKLGGKKHFWLEKASYYLLFYKFGSCTQYIRLLKIDKKRATFVDDSAPCFKYRTLSWTIDLPLSARYHYSISNGARWKDLKPQCGTYFYFKFRLHCDSFANAK